MNCERRTADAQLDRSAVGGRQLGVVALVVLFVILGNLGILFQWRFFVRLKGEVPQAWAEIGCPSTLETFAPSRLPEHLAWRRTLNKFNAPSPIRRLLTLSEFAGALAVACWFCLLAVILGQVSAS